METGVYYRVQGDMKTSRLFVILITITASVLVTVILKGLQEPQNIVQNSYTATSVGVSRNLVKNLKGYENLKIRELYSLVNTYRIMNELEPYRIDERLEYSAECKAEDMIKKGYWAHYTTDEYSGIWNFFTNAGYDLYRGGENLSEGYKIPSSVMTAWKKSPSHNKALLSKNLVDMGLGVACTDDWIDHEPTCIVVLHMGIERLK